MKALLEAGIVDLGGKGPDDFFLELEYKNGEALFREAIYRISDSFAVEEPIAYSTTNEEVKVLFHCGKVVRVPIPDGCQELIELRLPVSMSATNLVGYLPRM